MHPYKRIWQLSLFSFIVAAITGFFYRYGMLYPMPESLNLDNIRHAHSHLMFFNWISPPIMIFMVSRIMDHSAGQSSNDQNRMPSFQWCFYTMLFLGFLSFPYFLLYGYQSVPIGSAELPVAAIISGFVMITWYWFGYLYYKEHTKDKTTLSITLFDASLVALIISSLGAWSVSVFQFTTADSALISSALTHFFLAVFTEGWAILAVLGLLWSRIDDQKPLPIATGWLWIPILFGSMLIFPFGLTQTLLTPVMLVTAKTGTILIAISMLLNLYFLHREGVFKGFLWKSVALFIVFKIVFQLAAVLPLDLWPGEHGLRVLYLHLIMLGLVSTVLFSSYRKESSQYPEILFITSVCIVLVSLLMISGYWPPQMQPANLYRWVMLAAILPALPVIWIWIRSFTSNEE